MKKNTRVLALMLAMILLLAACGSSAGASAPAGNYYAADAPAMEAAAEEAEMGDWDYAGNDYLDIDAAEAPMAAAGSEGASSNAQSAEGITEGTPAAADLSEKIIYSAYAEVETTEFDESVDAVYALMDRFGAFMETSSVTGNNLTDSYYGYGSSRTADFTLRVPKDRYSAMTSALSEVGNVTYLTSNADNITAQYTDTASRLSAYEVEETRLLEILGQADTVEDMITVESRLSDIRYEKEYLTSTLRNWDNQVAYSSVSLHLREVKVLTPEPEEEKTYWQQVGEGFMDTLRFLGEACKDIFRFFVAALPVLLILAVIAVVIVLLVRRSLKKKAAAGIPRAPVPPAAPDTPNDSRTDGTE
ncbi:MAG: DUF4349 domain-containing protein [Oscillospiraceae bacterium]|nr:DUF4349 domain-containing protein [Oscillospiraceae bacterium]